MTIQTADARALPFNDNFFDIVMSHWVVHNITEATDRRLALVQMARVLRTDGILVLTDIENRHEYLSLLPELGFSDAQVLVDPVKDKILAAVSFGSFRPATIIATKSAVS